MPTNEEKLEALLHDMHALEKYLRERGERTRILSLKFAENAKTNPGNREFDLSQSRMLSYQHEVWNEIGNQIEKLLKNYE
ncbi:MAG TPA: hypothetical protein VGN34_02540 [Ktedonobacteraceae bacterium]|jgi:hypothetical protein